MVVTDGTIDDSPTPEAQNARHWPSEHRSAPEQALLQVPQWVALVCAFTQMPPHWVMQAVEQMPLVPQTPRSRASDDEHTAQVGPQASVRSAGTHCCTELIVQRLVPGPQSHPQVHGLVVEARVQVGVVLGGPAGQALQLVPQLAGLLSGRHCMPQRWKPVWQVKSQTPLTQVAVAFAGALHVWHDGPQEVIESATQTLLQ
jgi:hypothetical protein